MSELAEVKPIFYFFNKKLPQNGMRIADIKNKRARNLLRGIDPESYSSIKNALDKIKTDCSKSDYKDSLLFIRTHYSFENNEIGQLFNEFCPKEVSRPCEYTVSEIEEQIEHYKKELIILTKYATEISVSLKENNFHRALDICNELIISKGVSIYLLRVISFITNRYQLFLLDDKEILSKIDNIKQNIKISNSNFISEVVSQLSNLRTSYLAICKRINEIPKEFDKGKIAKFFINPIPDSHDDFIKTLNSYYSFSLFDAFLYLKTISRFNLPYLPKNSIDYELSLEYQSFSGVEFKPNTIYKEITEDTSHFYLRECFLFMEQEKAMNYFLIHGGYYTLYGESKKINQFAKPFINDYFYGLRNLNQLRCSKIENAEVNWDKYDSTNCSMLENSSALIYLLNRKEGYLEANEQDLFVKLMSFTRDIGEICSPDLLEKIAYDAKEYTLKVVVQCLITINRKNQYTEHQLRATIQDFCRDEFDCNFIELLKYLHKVSPAVTEHLIVISNETFLSTLFHLTDKPIDALNLRADILFWYGEITKDERFKERAKTLRIDIQINKEKGTIDDSRIYVDPLNFQQWFEDNIVSKLTMILDNLMISNNSVKLDWSNKGTSVSNGEELIECLLTCYKEFCENKVFGIASYLGRRIRHGTFKGTAITEIQKLPSQPEYHSIFEDRDFKRKIDEWLYQYEEMIEDLVKNYLQIKSKRKPLGLITTEIDTATKKLIANQLVYEILSIYPTRTGVIRLPNIITDYCWRLVEQDLSKTKKLLSQKKSNHGVFSYSAKNQNFNLRRSFYNFTQEVNSLTGQKFGLMSSWFNKPSYASPSADIYLLFNAVISEVKERVMGFEPSVDVGVKTFTIDGGTYYILYDALYVLIDNAAKHGKQDGNIYFHVCQCDSDVITLELSTEVSNINDMNNAIYNIKDFLSRADENHDFLDDAHIIEGNSGIKKIKKLEKEGSISNLTFSSDENKLLLNFKFDFNLNHRGVFNDIDS